MSDIALCDECGFNDAVVTLEGDVFTEGKWTMTIVEQLCEGCALLSGVSFDDLDRFNPSE